MKRLNNQWLNVLLVVSVIQATTCFAQEPLPAVRIQARDIPWPEQQHAKTEGTSMRPGLQILVITGDAKQPGLYSMLFKVPPNTVIPSHAHPDNRSCFVLSGVWYFGYGSERNDDDMAILPTGSHYTEPASVNHFAGTQDEGAVVECTAVGPTGTTFVNPADDPRAQK
jgi:quercetin dioxygenase-like cupin family protein